MTRNLKALGLALVAVFAMSAIAASAAHAETEGHVTSTGPVTLKGTDTGATLENSLTVTVLGSTTKIHCPESHYTGHKLNVTPHQRLTSGETQITVTTITTNCTDGTNAITVNMNGCDWQFLDFTTTGGVAGTYGIRADITCPGTNKIEMTGSACAIKIGAQTDLTGLHATNTGSGTSDSIDITGTVNVAASACGIGITAVKHVDFNMRGFNNVEAETGVTISDQ